MLDCFLARLYTYSKGINMLSSSGYAIKLYQSVMYWLQYNFVVFFLIAVFKKSDRFLRMDANFNARWTTRDAKIL